MEFHILGPVSASSEGQEVAIGGAKQRTVLAALLLAEGKVLSNTQLGTFLWDVKPPATAAAQIHTYLSRLRNLFGHDTIVRQRRGYLIRLRDAWFDHQEFERLVGVGHREMAVGRYGKAAHCLRAALALWRGPTLANVTQNLANSVVPRLDEARMAALESRIEAELCMGNHRALVSELTGLVAENPFREKLRAQLMIALYRCDRQADALGVYQYGRKILEEELGVDPGDALSQALRHVLTGESALYSPAAAPAVQVWSQVRPSMLPHDVVDFTGRSAALKEICRLLRVGPAERGPQSMLITGMAGVGKSALAVRAAHACLRDYPDGQLYIDLCASSGEPKSASEVLGLFLTVLGVEDWAIPTGLDERMYLYRSLLADRRMLVVLDDASSASQIRPLLPGGSRCGVLVTSRSRMIVLDGISVVNLGVLEPEPARRLFRRIVGTGRVNAEPAAAGGIVEMCGRLPLALRISGTLLAAQPQLTLSSFARRLADPRHRLDELECDDLSVRESLRHSFELLDRNARAMLCRLSVIDAPLFTARSAALVLHTGEAATERALETLADSQLLQVSGLEVEGMTRYRFHPLMLCMIREVAELAAPRC